MSTVYNGQGSLVTPTVSQGMRRAIVSSTNATPIVLQVTAHGYNTGDTVEVQGHQTNTNANGIRQIVVTDANHFQLLGSVGNGVGGATGYTTDYELQPAIVIPANAELADMGPLGAALEGIANPAPFLYRAAGAFRVVGIYQAIQHGVTSTNNTQVLGSFANCTGLTGLFSFASPIPVIESGDLLEVEVAISSLTLTGNTGSTSATANYCLGISQNGGAYAALSNGQRSFIGGPATATPPGGILAVPVSLKTYYTSGGNEITFDFSVMYNLSVALTTGVNSLTGDVYAVAKHYRPN